MAATQANTQNLMSIFWLVLVVGVFYFLAIRPQQKRQKEHAQLVSATKAGDKIVTLGGVYGTVKQVGEKTVTIEIAKGTSVVFEKSAVAKRQPSETPGEES